MLFHQDRIGGIFDLENFSLAISLNFQAGGRGAKLNLLGPSVGYASQSLLDISPSPSFSLSFHFRACNDPSMLLPEDTDYTWEGFTAAAGGVGVTTISYMTV